MAFVSVNQTTVVGDYFSANKHIECKGVVKCKKLDLTGETITHPSGVLNVANLSSLSQLSQAELQAIVTNSQNLTVSVEDITDVNVSQPLSDRSVLEYDSSTSEWVNVPSLAPSVTSLQNSMSAVQSQANATDVSTGVNAQDILGLTQSVNDLNSRVGQTETTVNSQGSDVTSLQTTLNSQNDSLTSQITTVSGDITSIQTTISDQNTTLTSQIGGLQSSLSALETRVGVTESGVSSSASQSALDAQSNALSTQISNQNASLTSQINAVTATATQNSSDITASQASVANLQTFVGTDSTSPTYTQSLKHQLDEMSVSATRVPLYVNFGVAAFLTVDSSGSVRFGGTDVRGTSTYATPCTWAGLFGPDNDITKRKEITTVPTASLHVDGRGNCSVKSGVNNDGGTGNDGSIGGFENHALIGNIETWKYKDSGYTLAFKMNDYVRAAYNETDLTTNSGIIEWDRFQRTVMCYDVMQNSTTNPDTRFLYRFRLKVLNHSRVEVDLLLAKNNDSVANTGYTVGNLVTSTYATNHARANFSSYTNDNGDQLQPLDRTSDLLWVLKFNRSEGLVVDIVDLKPVDGYGHSTSINTSAIHRSNDFPMAATHTNAEVLSSGSNDIWFAGPGCLMAGSGIYTAHYDIEDLRTDNRHHHNKDSYADKACFQGNTLAPQNFESSGASIGDVMVFDHVLSDSEILRVANSNSRELWN